MTIAVHIPGSKPASSFYYWCFKEMAKAYTAVRFLFITDGNELDKNELSSNCDTVHISPAITNKLSHYFWYQMKLPPVLEKFNVTGFFTPGFYCSIRSDVRQIMLINDENAAGAYTKLGLSTKYIKTASAIAFTEKQFAKRLLFKYPAIRNKMVFTGRGIHPLYVPSPTSVNPFADRNYFVCIINEENKSEAKKLLKAYSIFKKWQHSSIEIVCVLETKAEEFPVEDFNSYKYRTQVHVVHLPLSEVRADIYKGAFCWIGLSEKEHLLEDALRAMSCNIPVMYTSATDLPSDIYVEAKLTEQSLAEKMMVVYRDEYLMNQLKFNAHQYLKKYNWEDMHTMLYRLAKGETVETT